MNKLDLRVADNSNNWPSTTNGMCFVNGQVYITRTLALSVFVLWRQKVGMFPGHWFSKRKIFPRMLWADMAFRVNRCICCVLQYLHVIALEEKITKIEDNSAWTMLKDPITIMNDVYHIERTNDYKSEEKKIGICSDRSYDWHDCQNPFNNIYSAVTANSLSGFTVNTVSYHTLTHKFECFWSDSGKSSCQQKQDCGDNSDTRWCSMWISKLFYYSWPVIQCSLELISNWHRTNCAIPPYAQVPVLLIFESFLLVLHRKATFEATDFLAAQSQVVLWYNKTYWIL